MAIKRSGIGFFDSGIGGLTVLSSCLELIEEKVFYYYGDNEHAPYGNRSMEEIRPFVYKAFDMFERLNVKAAVIACNTVTALFIDELRSRYAFPIVGAEPAILPAMRIGGEVFVLATRNTFESIRFQNICARARRAYPNAKLHAFSCDGLAGEIEKHISEKAYDYTAMFPKGTPSSVVLGCTHYVHIKETIENFYGCRAFDGNAAIARRLGDVLQNRSENRFEIGTDDHCGTKDKKFCPFLTPWLRKRDRQRLFVPSKKPRKRYSLKCVRTVYFLGKKAFYNFDFYKRMFEFYKNNA